MKNLLLSLSLLLSGSSAFASTIIIPGTIRSDNTVQTPGGPAVLIEKNIATLYQLDSSALSHAIPNGWTLGKPFPLAALTLDTRFSPVKLSQESAQTSPTFTSGSGDQLAETSFSCNSETGVVKWNGIYGNGFSEVAVIENP